MNMTINKTRIRPSINIGPNVKHTENDYGFVYTNKQSTIIQREIERLIYNHVREHAFINDKMYDTGLVPKPDYDKAMHNQGCKFIRCAFVCACINKEYNKALYWLRKCWACFEYDGVFLLKDKGGWDGERDYLWLYTDIQNDSYWSIAATVKVTSFLGTTETSSHIGTIKEEADLTNMRVLLHQFEQHVKDEHEKRKGNDRNFLRTGETIER